MSKPTYEELAQAILLWDKKRKGLQWEQTMMELKLTNIAERLKGCQCLPS